MAEWDIVRTGIRLPPTETIVFHKQKLSFEYQNILSLKSLRGNSQESQIKCNKKEKMWSIKKIKTLKTKSKIKPHHIWFSSAGGFGRCHLSYHSHALIRQVDAIRRTTECLAASIWWSRTVGRGLVVKCQCRLSVCVSLLFNKGYEIHFKEGLLSKCRQRQWLANTELWTLEVAGEC